MENPLYQSILQVEAQALVATTLVTSLLHALPAEIRAIALEKFDADTEVAVSSFAGQGILDLSDAIRRYSNFWNDAYRPGLQG